jgi:hypothetical protein
MIEEKLGRSTESMTSQNIIMLRQTYASIRDGIGKISDFFKETEAEMAENKINIEIPVKKAPIKQAEAAPVESTPDSDIDALREALKSVQSIAELDDILTKNKLQFLELHKNDPEIFMELSDLAEDKRREFEQK